jgi:hypothetical protein
MNTKNLLHHRCNQRASAYVRLKPADNGSAGHGNASTTTTQRAFTTSAFFFLSHNVTIPNYCPIFFFLSGFAWLNAAHTL